MSSPPPHVAAYRQRMTFWALATLAGALLVAYAVHAGDIYAGIGGVLLAAATGVPCLLLDEPTTPAT